jgi:hypothetical protein
MCMYVCMYVCLSVCMYIYVCIYVYLFLCNHDLMFVDTHIIAVYQSCINSGGRPAEIQIWNLQLRMFAKRRKEAGEMPQIQRVCRQPYLVRINISVYCESKVHVFRSHLNISTLHIKTVTRHQSDPILPQADAVHLQGKSHGALRVST